MQNSSLPVGGKGIHAVISGHTALPTAELFTDLDQVEKGDVFYIHILKETLAYRVYDIETVLLEQVESLGIVQGRDLVTLVTCTPYGINSHRLLIHAERTVYDGEQGDQAAAMQKSLWQWLLSQKTFLLSAGLILIVLLYGIIRFIRRIRKNSPQKEGGGEPMKQRFFTIRNHGVLLTVLLVLSLALGTFTDVHVYAEDGDAPVVAEAYDPDAPGSIRVELSDIAGQENVSKDGVELTLYKVGDIHTENHYIQFSLTEELREVESLSGFDLNAITTGEANKEAAGLLETAVREADITPAGVEYTETVTDEAGVSTDGVAVFDGEDGKGLAQGYVPACADQRQCLRYHQFGADRHSVYGRRRSLDV